MNTITFFDTHTFVKRLTQAGMPEAQARLIDEKLATKHDLKKLETRLTHNLSELGLRLTIHLGSILVIAVGVVAH